jgi:hypothetical protein
MSPRAVPVCARNTATVIIPTPGMMSSRRGSGEASTNRARSRSMVAISSVRKSICLSAASIVSRSSAGTG